MSCEFCNTYDFTSIAVRDNNIHMAGGSSRYTDPDVNRGRYKLFQYCPLCGANLLYGTPELEKNYKKDAYPVRVAVDGMGNRIPFAIEDDDTVLTEEEYYTISQLKADTGCGFQMCKDAYRYAESHNGGYGMMVAYCKAKLYAVKTNVPFHTRIERFMEDMK